MSLAKLRDRLLQKFVRDPAGYGRPVPAAAFDREYRSGNWDHFSSFAELPRTLVLAGAIHHFLPGAPSVLDLGAGSGRLAVALQPYAPGRYLGVDLSPEAVARARALGLPGMEFVEGDFETWRPAEKFDAIVFNESIGYARDPAATCRAFAAHLTPGGKFFVSLYQSGNFAAQWRRLEGACTLVEAAAVRDRTGEKTWDIKVLAPRP
jgi:SAM-dependent methyltransferase